MTERRHELDPHPPEGTLERRCSDSACRAARLEWFDNEIVPKIKQLIGISIVTAVATCTATFLAIGDYLITKHELRAKDIYETQVQHDNDVAELRTLIREMRQGIEESFDAIADRLDRNLSAIEKRERR